jgi:tetratricopeptide (TPR) repeat protein
MDEQALVLLSQLATTLPTTAHLKRGDIFAEAGKWREAAEAYEQSWKADTKQALPLWLTGFAHEQLGNKQLGQKQRLMARLLPLGDEKARTDFCDELNKRSDFLGDAVRAELRFHRQLIVDVSSPGSNHARDALSQLCQNGAGFPDRGAAAEANKRFLIRMMRTNAYFKNNNGYLTVLHRMHAERAKDLLNRGDIAGATQAAKEAHAILPNTYVLAVELVPDLMKRNKSDEANNVYQPVADAMDRLVKDYPQSANFAGNRAWLAARCRRDMDKALELAKKAVDLAPESAAHRETLSEVYLQRGDKSAAKAALQPALTKQPKNVYLQKLMRRIETGDGNAPLPER